MTRFSGRQPKEMIERELEREKWIVNAEGRLKVYRELLHEVAKQMTANHWEDDFYGKDHVTFDSYDGLITRINRALSADADEIARMVDEWAQGRGA